MILSKESRQARMYARFGIHQRASRKVTRIATDFFKTQAERVANRFEGVGGVHLARELLAPEDESESLIENLIAPFLKTMTDGAQLALADGVPLTRALARAWRSGHKVSTATLASIQYEIDALELELEIPRELLLQIRTALQENLDAPYWVAIQDDVVRDIQSLIDTSIADGWSIRRTAQAIENTMTNMSRTRATRIARTEVSGALNGGQVAGIAQLEAESGLTMTKEWLSVQGNTTRESHAEADGQEVPVAGEFIVGGHSCRFPGDWQLPAAERVNCQCGVLSGFVGG
ncbi:phage minor head protein [Bremerella sp. JC770]|uniref:phage minor head protein n=1 Tax=Bremerella sp. JC770 TaxID=3232137 RepID=UPI0034593D33